MIAASNKNTFFNDVLSNEDRLKVSAFIEKNAGIQCPRSKHNLVESRLRKRQRHLGISTISEYISFALETKEGAVERMHLVDALTTNKTDFYREINHFQFFQLWLKRQLIEGREWRENQALRCWSAGCSSGEEPYTLAIELLETKAQFEHFNFRVMATDISQTCLQTAKRAVYPHSAIEPIAMNLRKRYLLKSQNKSKALVKMAPQVRSAVSFKSFNLLHDNYRSLGKFDIIFCRNVMIYFNNTNKGYVLEKFARQLNPGGLLFIGHSENIVGFDATFEKIQPTIYRLPPS